MDESRLAGKVALITGGGRGIGRAIARRFVREGACVMLTQRDEASGMATARDLIDLGGDVVFLTGDVTNRQQMSSVVQQAVQRWGHIDILVNNAAVMGANGPFLEIADEVWQRVLATNLNGAFTCSQLAGAEMARQGGGVIINISSTNGRMPQLHCAAYAAAKGALENLTRAMAIDLAPYHIRVNTVAPGPIQSRSPESAAPQPTASTLMGRWGLTDEVAAAVAFLASDDASFITGESILVDGGLLVNSRRLYAEEVTMQTVGLYTEAGTILKNPAYFESLQRAVGLNLVIIGYSGQLPESVINKSPLNNQPDVMVAIKAVLAQHIDGGLCSSQPELAANWVGPHIGRGGDDPALRRAIDQAHRQGLQVWLVAGAWTANDFHTLMFCPNHPAVNEWYEAVFTHLAGAYGVDGLDITHARYPMTSEPRGLGLCACPFCARAAEEAGHDMLRMVDDIKASLAALRQVDMPRLRRLHWDSLSLTDLWQMLGMRPGLFEWFAFRADTLTRNLQRCRELVHRAAGEDFIFGADTYPSSMAWYAGHDQARWDVGSDFASPLVSHVDIFVLKTWAAWARWLQTTINGITEGEALRLVYRLTGYDGLSLPSAISDYALGEPDCEFRNIPLRELLAHDMAKARMTLPLSIPSYPIIQGGGAPYLWPKATIEGVIADAERLGHQGVMLQGTASLAPGVA